MPASDNALGYSDIFSVVYLPSAANGEISENPGGVTNTRDSCSIYMGGWSAGTYPDAVDAGFTYDTSIPGRDGYTLILSSSKYGYINPTVGSGSGGSGSYPTQGVMSTDAIRFFSGQSVYLEFFVAPGDSGGNQIDVAATGDVYDYTQQFHNDIGEATYTIGLAVPAGSGWNTSGYGMVLKRNTSIAQQIVPKPAQPPYTCDNFTTGSFMKNVVWSDCQIGYYNNAGSLHDWTSTDTNYVPGNYPNDDPPAGTGTTYSNIIQTQYASGSSDNDPAGETDSIIMLPPK